MKQTCILTFSSGCNYYKKSAWNFSLFFFGICIQTLIHFFYQTHMHVKHTHTHTHTHTFSLHKWCRTCTRCLMCDYTELGVCISYIMQRQLKECVVAKAYNFPLMECSCCCSCCNTIFPLPQACYSNRNRSQKCCLVHFRKEP